MSDSKIARRDPALLPGVGGPSPGVTLAILFLSLIAALDLIAVAVAARTFQAWPARLAGSVTVVATGGGIESADAAAARVAEILGRTPGVSRVRVLDPAPEDALAARIMGASSGGGPTVDEPDLPQPTPRLLNVVFSPGSSLSARGLTKILADQGPRVTMDDHGLWSGPLERAALVAAAAAAMLLVVLLWGVWSLVAGGVGRAFGRHAERLTLLTHLGAAEPVLGGPFRRGLTLATTVGAALGVFAAAGAGALLIWSPEAAIALAGRGVQLPPIEPFDLAAGLAWLPVAVAVGALAARVAAIAALRRMS
jgi:cell division protein FtsX